MTERYSTYEIADFVGVSPATIQRLIREGRLTPDSYTPGGHARLDLERVKAELARMSEEKVRSRSRR